jgi:hypothetical protein
MWYAEKESRDPLNGPRAIGETVEAEDAACARMRDCHRGELTPAAAANADVSRNLRRVSVRFMAGLSSPLTYVSFSPVIFSE